MTGLAVTTTGIPRTWAWVLLAGVLAACSGSTGPAAPRDVPDGGGPDAVAQDPGPASDDGDTGGRDLAGVDTPPDDAAAADSTAPDAPVPDFPPGSFDGTLLLGSPTATSIRIGVLSATVNATVTIDYGTPPGTWDRQTAPVALTPGEPLVLALDGLEADAPYGYRLRVMAPDGGAQYATDMHAFHTARPAGSTFTFTVQADSHLDENSDLPLYQRTLDNVLADAPDFHVDLGDTFMCEKHTQPLDATVQMAPDAPTVDARYVYERGNFGRMTHSVPLFLVNGNHEGEAGWLLENTGNDLAVWATKARERYYLNPAPDGFYTGNGIDEPFVGKRASWYAWQWGDALFIALDPFWKTSTKPGQDAWGLSLGEDQYRWLEQTLSSSTATFKFVFIHNLVGGLDGQMRGGAEAAPFYEWGGQNADGTPGFDANRPGWGQPIHQMLIDHGVSAVFHGHDHLYVKQDLDGIVYQEVPQPSCPNFNSGPSLATKFHYAGGTVLGSAGHLRVTVSPDSAKVEYVRAYRPQDEKGGLYNGQIDDTWVIPAK